MSKIANLAVSNTYLDVCFIIRYDRIRVPGDAGPLSATVYCIPRSIGLPRRVSTILQWLSYFSAELSLTY